MLKFLLDENCSHKTAAYLRTLGHEATTASEEGLGHTDDETIVQHAIKHDWIIVTFDLDFGYLFRILSPHTLGIVVLRLENQTVESANAALGRLLKENILNEEDNQKALIVIDENVIRVRK